MATLNDLKYQKKANEIEIAKNLPNKADLIKQNKLLSNQIKVLEPPKTQKISKPIKHRTFIICHDCKVTFMGKKELVCGNCYSKYKNNILHVITATEEIIFNDYQVQEAEEYLSNITCTFSEASINT